MLSHRAPGVVILPSDVWTEWVDSIGQSVQYSYVGTTPLLRQPFIILPMLVNKNHWIVSIFAYSDHATRANKMLPITESLTSLFILDSLHGKHPHLELKLKALLSHLVNTSEDPDDQIRIKVLKKIPVYYPEVRV